MERVIPFALPYEPDEAPIVELIGIGFRPAWQPADYIGPRMDCPMWVTAPDADDAYSAKYDGPVEQITDDGWLDVNPADWVYKQPSKPTPVVMTPHGPGSILPPGINWPSLPPTHGTCCSIIHPTDPPVIITPEPPPAVSLAGTAGYMLAAIIILTVSKTAFKMAGRFGDWFTAERGAGEGKNGWL